MVESARLTLAIVGFPDSLIPLIASRMTAALSVSYTKKNLNLSMNMRLCQNSYEKIYRATLICMTESETCWPFWNETLGQFLDGAFTNVTLAADVCRSLRLSSSSPWCRNNRSRNDSSVAPGYKASSSSNHSNPRWSASRMSFFGVRTCIQQYQYKIKYAQTFIYKYIFGNKEMVGKFLQEHH